MSNPTDYPALAGVTALAYLASLAGVTDPAIIELLLAGAGVFFAMVVLAVIIPQGRKLRGMFVSLVSGSVASILAIAFVPLEWRFVGLSGLMLFTCIVYVSPLLQTIRSLTRDRELVSSWLRRRD